MSNTSSTKPAFILAVHGIGDQVRNATIQQVTAQFCRHFNKANKAAASKPEAVPLGAFDMGPVKRTFTMADGTRRDFYFWEAYWADIAREVAREGYTLEETKRWTNSIVDRLAHRDPDSNVNYTLVRQVLAEMVEAIAVLERLTFLADKAGVAKFELNKVLVDYLDDVQLVTEFGKRRERILERFNAALARPFDEAKRLALNAASKRAASQQDLELVNRAHDSVLQDPGCKAVDNADIYIVAHSEGTVVAFMALLKAMYAGTTPSWLPRVRGFLTIGSPIDKHLALWRTELFEQWEKATPQFNPTKPEVAGQTDSRIKWRNYYDLGDPVGFELDGARSWMKDRGLTAFEFDEKPKEDPTAPDPEHDNGFSRYFLPGKAHNDYWKDPDVFDHFIDRVVNPMAERPPKPKTEFWPPLVAYVASYGLALLLLVLAVFFVMRTVASFNAEVAKAAATAGAAAPTGAVKASTISGFKLVRDSFGIAFLLAGMTVLARVPRLVCPFKSRQWLLYAPLIFAAFAALFCLTSPESRRAMAALPADAFSIQGTIALTAWSIGLAFIIALVAAGLGRTRDVGAKPLVALGGATALLIVLGLVKRDVSGEASLWPVLLALAGFLYLWWVAILLFDLIFVWHRYIRFGVAADRLRHICGLKQARRSGPQRESKEAANWEQAPKSA